MKAAPKHNSEYWDDPPPSSERVRIMSSVAQKNTRPELLVRRLLHRKGYRFRLHQKDLPGVPDIVFPGRRKIIFVHGCFWHRHPGCPRASLPKTRVAYWRKKFAANVVRDRRTSRKLKELGWKIGVVWECELKDTKNLEDKLDHFLNS